MNRTLELTSYDRSPDESSNNHRDELVKPSLRDVYLELEVIPETNCVTLSDNSGASISFCKIASEIEFRIGFDNRMAIAAEHISKDKIAERFACFFHGDIRSLCLFEWGRVDGFFAEIPDTVDQLIDQVEMLKSICSNLSGNIARIRLASNPEMERLAYLELSHEGQAEEHVWIEDGCLYLYWIDPETLIYYSETLTSVSAIDILSLSDSYISPSALNLRHE